MKAYNSIRSRSVIIEENVKEEEEIKRHMSAIQTTMIKILTKFRKYPFGARYCSTKQRFKKNKTILNSFKNYGRSHTPFRNQDLSSPKEEMYTRKLNNSNVQDGTDRCLVYHIKRRNILKYNLIYSTYISQKIYLQKLSCLTKMFHWSLNLVVDFPRHRMYQEQIEETL